MSISVVREPGNYKSQTACSVFFGARWTEILAVEIENSSFEFWFESARFKIKPR